MLNLTKKSKFISHKKVVVLFSILLIFSSLFATEEIELLKNPELTELQLEKVNDVNFGDNILDYNTWIVADGKIYFCSMLQKEVAIFDLNGTEINRINSVGRGPGEFQMPQTVLHYPEKDRIAVFDNMQRKFIYYSYDGNYIEDEMAGTNKIEIPQARKQFGENSVNYLFKMNITKDNIVMSPTIQIEKSDENITVESQDVDLKMMQMDPSQFSYIYTCDDENVYVSKYSIEDFVINVYDTNGEMVKEITKSFKKKKKSKEDLEKLEAKLDEYSNMTKEMGVDQKFDTSNLKYMESIRQLLVDNKNNLWIGTFDEDKKYCFYIMNKNGELITKWVPEKNNVDVRIYENKLVELYNDDNDKLHMNVYQL